MVGVPRSRGCSLCIQRRVKCDQVRPMCRNCIRYGVECPGYNRELKFVANKHGVRVKPKATTLNLKNRPNSAPLQRTSRAHEPTFSACSTAASSPQDEALDTDEREYQATRGVISFASPPRPSYTLYTTPKANRAQYINSIIDAIELGEKRNNLAIFDYWFEQVPSRLGKKASLDSSTCALVLQLLGKIHKDERVLSLSRRLYGQSLSELQRAICHPTEWKSSETLCAAMILSIFECFAGTTPRSWRKHVDGVSQLIQLRGPASFNNGWDHGMLIAYRGFLNASSILQQKECFIVRKPWRELCKHHSFKTHYGQSARGPISPKYLVLVDEYMLGLADLTSVFKDVIEFHNNIRQHIEVKLEHKAKLQAICEQHLANWEAWLRKMTPLISSRVEIPSQDSGSMFSTRLEFGNPWIGMLFAGSWACSLFLMKALNLLDPARYSHFEEETEKLRLDILRSIASLGTGISGAFRIGLIIRIIFDFTTPMEQIWLRQTLNRLKPLYGSVDETSYSPQYSSTSQPIQDGRSTAVG